MIEEKVSSWLSIDEVAQMLEISPGKVRRLIDEKYLFSHRVNKQPMIPADIIVDGEPLSSIHGTLVLLADLGMGDEEAIAWLYEVNPELGTEPMTSLLAGHKAPVRRAAQGLG
ncbi:MAG: Rv2175c family DNA-binding protein [Aquiluna sp.]|nr:Rv2175c family DNA-binding protein [Aquiluna sp.]